MFTFVTGGLQSGKSGYAMRRASEMGPPPWIYLAPDAEENETLKERLAGYRRDPEAIWRVRDIAAAPGDALAPSVIEGHGAMVLDRFSVWFSKRIAEASGLPDAALLAEVERFSDQLYRCPIPGVLVTTEVGLGLLPTSIPDRRLVRLLGQANQLMAERASSVVLMVSGVAQRLR